MAYLYTFRIFVLKNNIFMHTVDFKNDTYTLCNIEIFHVKYTDFSSILYLTSFSVDNKVKSHVLHTFVNLTSYVYIFQHICKLNDIFAHFLIFINICAIFMHNVDFNSDPYTLCNIWNFPCQVHRISSIYNLKTFSVHSGVKCPVLQPLIKNKWHICTLLGYLFSKMTYLCTL